MPKLRILTPIEQAYVKDKHNWEAVNGPVPSGHCLWCLDDNRHNCDPDNWELITRVENSRRNNIVAHVLLSDNYVASTITHNDKELRAELVKNHPDIIELKRNEILLNRAIKQQQYGK